MKIRSYLKKHNLTQEEFAKKVGVSPGAVWQWINGESRVDPRRVRKIEAITEGEVSRHDLRPDIYETA